MGNKLTLTANIELNGVPLLGYSKGFMFTGQLGKRVKKQGTILQTKTNKLAYVGFEEGNPFSTVQLTVADLEKLLAQAKQSYRKFKKDDKKAGRPTSFFLHLSPDVSFFFVEPKRKKKK